MSSIVRKGTGGQIHQQHDKTNDSRKIKTATDRLPSSFPSLLPSSEKGTSWDGISELRRTRPQNSRIIGERELEEMGPCRGRNQETSRETCSKRFTYLEICRAAGYVTRAGLARWLLGWPAGATHVVLLNHIRSKQRSSLRDDPISHSITVSQRRLLALTSVTPR